MLFHPVPPIDSTSRVEHLFNAIEEHTLLDEAITEIVSQAVFPGLITLFILPHTYNNIRTANAIWMYQEMAALLDCSIRLYRKIFLDFEMQELEN